MLAKGSWKIDAAQSLSGSLRYYNNAAQEPKNPQTSTADSSSNPLTDRSTIQRDAQLGYHLAPQGNDWLNADAKIYWSEARINAQNIDGSGEWRMSGNTLQLFTAGVPGGPIRKPAAMAIFKSPPVGNFTLDVELRSTAPVSESRGQPSSTHCLNPARTRGRRQRRSP